MGALDENPKYQIPSTKQTEDSKIEIFIVGTLVIDYCLGFGNCDLDIARSGASGGIGQW